MGIEQRREREKQELHQQILNAAMELFIDQGYEKTSIRNIAEKVEYSPGTIYLYFKDKSEILLALHDLAFEKLFEKLESTLVIENPIVRLQAMGEVYIQFAIDHPELYDLMFILKDPINALKDHDHWECGLRNFYILRDTIAECIEKGLIKGDNAEIVAVGTWATVHGLASLYIRQRFKMIPDDQLRPMLSAVVQQFVDQIRR